MFERQKQSNGFANFAATLRKHLFGSNWLILKPQEKDLFQLCFWSFPGLFHGSNYAQAAAFGIQRALVAWSLNSYSIITVSGSPQIMDDNLGQKMRMKSNGTSDC